MNAIGHFKLQPSDGIHCAQVLIYNDDDLKYWVAEAKRTGHLIGLDYHALKDGLGYSDPEHDVYQIFPPEQADKFKRIKLVE